MELGVALWVKGFRKLGEKSPEGNPRSKQDWPSINKFWGHLLKYLVILNYRKCASVTKCL